MKKILFMGALLVCAASCGGSKNDTIGYAGRDLSETVKISRDKESRQASVVIAGLPYPWRIFAGPSVEKIDMTEALYKGVTGGVYNLDVPRDHRSYFQFISGDDKTILAERQLPLSGGYNFRDIGGYRTKDGKYVKWGKIFRSDDLSSLTQGDLNYIGSIPIKSVVDFRSKQEMDMAQDKMPLPDTKYYQLSIEPGNLSDLRNFMNLNAEDIEKRMVEMNGYFVTEENAIAKWKEFFRLLQQDGKEPLVFHCSAGKDRTGMAAALTLLALGVPEETVMDDYLLSNRYLTGKYQEYIDRYPQLKSLFLVKREFLQTALDKMKSQYGSVESFLTGKLDVDLVKFREKYLY